MVLSTGKKRKRNKLQRKLTSAQRIPTFINCHEKDVDDNKGNRACLDELSCGNKERSIRNWYEEILVVKLQRQPGERAQS